MKISRHIAFRADTHPDLAAWAQSSGLVQSDPKDIIMTFDITEDDSRWPVMAEFLTKKPKLLVIAKTIFTERERREAEWLTVRSKWCNGYPQPESGNEYLRVTYDTADACPECGGGLKQRDAFRLTSAPKWGNRHFMMLNWVFDELFVDEIARSVLESSGMSGFHFLHVLDRRGQKTLPGVHQLVMEETTIPGLISEGVTSIDTVEICPACGRTNYHSTGIGMHAYDGAALRGMPAICRTGESFGGRADRMILIRQDLYRTLIENKLERSLVFEPVRLV